ncbi:MAG: 3-oxoacyl-ACP synthase, partial [Deltaproteobacteria bacterium]|nr:3-oxoacyl-ACP synthase [Deltaproteobacteria bacterium]
NKVVPDAVRDLLSRNQLSQDDIGCFVFHQASQVALDGINRILRIPPERLVIDLTTTGNLVAASVPTALRRAELAGRLKTGEYAVLCGFGVGLSWATALIRT